MEPLNANNLIDYIVAYENDELEPQLIVELFAYLIRTGQAWSLQGSYGRGAVHFIDIGLISEDGEINEDQLEYMLGSPNSDPLVETP